MEPIGIIFVDMPRMLREIVRRAIDPQTDMVVLGEFPPLTDLLTAVETTAARCVVTDAATATHDATIRLLAAKPDVRVLGVTDDGRRCYLALGDVSPQTLVDAIRSGP